MHAQGREIDQDPIGTERSKGQCPKRVKPGKVPCEQKTSALPPDSDRCADIPNRQQCAISRHWDHRCDRASRGNEFTLALGLDFGLGGRILSGTEFV